ncbi:MAG: GlsB/YeaQ/YmgE family stress response membrane protein [Chloroflexota bacterium]
MAYLLIGLLVVAVVLGAATWLTFTLIGFLLTLVVAGLVGWAADAVIPGRLPGGWLGAVLAGIVGGFMGTLLLGKVGPTIFDINIIPAFIGAALIAVAAELIVGSRSRALR